LPSYEAVYYNGWLEPPAYVLIDSVDGDTPEQALTDNKERLLEAVREMFSLEDDSDYHILETLYIIRENGLLPARQITLLKA